MFRRNTAAFVHDRPADAISNVAGEHDYVRVPAPTIADALGRGRRQEVTRRLTELAASAASGRRRSRRGRAAGGLWGKAHDDDELVGAARDETAAGG